MALRPVAAPDPDLDPAELVRGGAVGLAAEGGGGSPPASLRVAGDQLLPRGGQALIDGRRLAVGPCSAVPTGRGVRGVGNRLGGSLDGTGNRSGDRSDRIADDTHDRLNRIRARGGVGRARRAGLVSALLVLRHRSSWARRVALHAFMVR
jgi:hypothetical protein